MPPRRIEQEKVCRLNTAKNTAGLIASAGTWLAFACMTTVMSASIFGDINNGRLKHKKMNIGSISISYYQAAILCTGGLLEVSGLYLAIAMARRKREDEKKVQANCHCP